MSNVTQEQAAEALAILTAFVNGTEVESAAASVSIPTPEELADYSAEQITELANSLGITTEGVRAKVLKANIETLVNIVAGVEVEKEDADAVAEALGLTPDKKVEKTVAAINEWASAITNGETTTEEAASEGEASAEGEEAASTDGAEGEASTDESTDGAEGEASTDDGVDRAAVAKGFKDFPDEETMTERIEAYNATVEEQFHLKGKTTKDKYRALVAELVDTESNIAEWGTAYARDGQGYCCGLPLQDNDSPEGSGKCAVTEKVFVLNEDQTGFVEHVVKKAAPKAAAKPAPKAAVKPAAKPAAKK